ncbi:MAG: RDD family protein [Rhodocyclales bacterium]|nr:RDD family protein [Rhodocyclales bacterium]
MYCSKCGAKNNDEGRFCTACGVPLAVASAAPGPAEPFRETQPMPAPHYAGFWYRALALLIDFAISTVMAIVIAVPLGFATGTLLSGSASYFEIRNLGEGMGNLVGVLVNWLYFTLCESSPWQATLGKKVLGLKVTDVNGSRIGFGRANARYWSKLFSIFTLLIGYLMAAFTQRKQALHDMIAGTLVVRKAA